MRPGVALSIALVAACNSPPEQPTLTVFSDAASLEMVTASLERVPYARLVITETVDPAGELGGPASGVRIGVIADLDCTECYRLERIESSILVHGDAPLGIQYGLAHAFEQLGFRFFHPWRTRVPGVPAVVDAPDVYDVTFEPEIAQRGLQLHTLHPIEPYYAFWEPGPENLDGAEAIIDWIIKHRGNYVQWVALDNIQRDPAVADAWRDHTREILDIVHRRGMRAGIGVQLFGQSNLQLGFDLVDDEDGDPTPRAQMEERFPLVLDGLDFDSISLTFGEFFGAEPQQFIDSVNLAYEVMTERAPDTRMTATIHVGGSDDQRVEYNDQSMIYYFLIQFADERIVPWVHTVMYFDLFETAAGAYHHEDFAEHREFLLDRLRAGKPVGYHPETAYWVAFDNSVPTYLPLYVRSRWLDLAQIRATAGDGAAPLTEHAIFSTGWEWGYWQNDYAALRMSYRLPSSWESLFEEMFAPYGEDGTRAAELIAGVAAAQASGLIEGRLAPYLAGRDVYIELGDKLGIVSQPDRPTFAEVMAMAGSERARIADAMDRLAALADVTRRARDDIASLDLPGRDPFVAELGDGLAIDVARSEWIESLYRAALESADGGDPAPWLARADAALLVAQEIVARRHAALHHPGGERFLHGDTNATYYQWGYLKQTHELCYWVRERIDVVNVLDGSNETVPNCVF